MASLPFLLLLLFLAPEMDFSGGTAAEYHRPEARETLFVSVADDADGQTPQQVHISMVGPDRMRVTWITEDDAPATVDYGTETANYGMSSIGSTSSYAYTLLYKSGKIHEAVIGPLLPGTVYYYRCSGNPSREFSFKTPPAGLPFKFVVVGDLGQTGWTNSTLTHISNSDHDVLLLPGDLSYADFFQPRWDSFARLVEPLASRRPWMVTQGNHEIESIPFLEPKPFKPYNARWHMPFEQSSSPSNLFYSFDAAGGHIHVLMLGSYAEYGIGSEQYRWIKADIGKVERRRTAWVVAVVHAPWYNSNEAHQGEGEGMRKVVEELLHDGRVDVVFAGHVHAYERFVSGNKGLFGAASADKLSAARVYDNKEEECGAVHITVGDGGNREGLASDYINPQPRMSLFRQASFGHGKLEVVNSTQARWTWHRNEDDEPVVGDSVWIGSLAANPACVKANK